MKAGNKWSLLLRQEVHTVTVQRQAEYGKRQLLVHRQAKGKITQQDHPKSITLIKHSVQRDTEIPWIKVNRKKMQGEQTEVADTLCERGKSKMS